MDGIKVQTSEDVKPVMLFGRDLTKIPCFKQSHIYGICGGIGVMLGTFLFTSKATLSHQLGMGSFISITLTYWIVCRYDHLQRAKREQLIKEVMLKAAVLEGTSEGITLPVHESVKDV